jgi:hypothetical protein
MVEHDAARLVFDGTAYRLTMRRRLRNTGDQPVSRYLIRISVDRYPGEPERSNAHYRKFPLTWDEFAFPAHLDPVVWGTETSMTAQAAPLATAPTHVADDNVDVFTWSTDNPQLHARYRLEWRFRTETEQE